MVEMMRGEQYRFEFIGGEPCLDFTNTVGGDRRVDPSEHLHGYADLVAWARQGELLSPAQGRALLLRAQREPVAAAAALAAAVGLREALFEIFFGQAEGRRPAPQHLEVLNRALADALPHRRVVPSGRGVSLGWGDTGDLRPLLLPVALSPPELLARGHAPPLKLCGVRETTRGSRLFVDQR